MPSAHMQSPQSYSPPLNGQIGCPHLVTIEVQHISSSPQTFRGGVPLCLRDPLSGSAATSLSSFRKPFSLAGSQYEALSIEGARGALWCANHRKALRLGLQSFTQLESQWTGGRASSTHLNWPQWTNYSHTLRPHSSHPVATPMQTLATSSCQVSLW